MKTERKRVVIIGAGFGGLFVARHLADTDVDVVLIDRNNFHTFIPLIYQVATCGLGVEDVTYPLRKIFRQNKNIDFMMGEVTNVDHGTQQVTVITESLQEKVPYDYLVVAVGSVTNYFGDEDLKKRAFGLKTITDAVQLRNHVLKMFEDADKTDDTELRDALMTMVVVGGGPTGLETAGAMYELYDDVLRNEYRHLEGAPMRVVLVEMQDKLLGPYPERLQRSAKAQLESIGVETRLGNSVEEFGENYVRLADGTVIPTHTLIWATGVKASPFAQKLDVELAKNGRIPVEPTMEIIGRSNAYALGDVAYLEQEDGTPYPELIPVAQQQAKLLAKNILQRAKGQPQASFEYFDKGTMATIGRSRAVAYVFNRIQLTGFIAWISWLGLHLITLMGFRNRVSVFLNWLWSYIVYDRTSRVILKYNDPVVDTSSPVETPAQAEEAREEARIAS